MNTFISSTSSWNSQLYESKHAFVWQFGENLIDLLLPQVNEHILDVGCGTGQLTAKIAASGTRVTGIDSSETMIATAKQNHPELDFEVADARHLPYSSAFDAVFSNATLHWIQPPEAVTQSIYRALKPGGRFVAEFGGKGNVHAIVQALEQNILTQNILTQNILEQNTLAIESQQRTNNPWYFPSLGDYTSLLENNGFEVTYAVLFDRPTPLSGESGMENWLRMFANSWLQPLSPTQQNALVEAIEHQLRPILYRDGIWLADYRRLRVMAIREG